jgi:uncharacterized protein (DUF2062 family)
MYRSVARQDYLVHSDYAARKHRHVVLRSIATLCGEFRRATLEPIPPEDRMNEGFLHRRLLRPVLDLLKQGVTPEKLALSLALGAVLGVFPALGCTTLLCALAAFALGLNLPAIQIVNYFMYPLQIALLIPFFRLGEKLFRAPHLPIFVSQIYAMAHANLWAAIKLLWSTTWHAIVVWALLAPLVTAAVYFTLAPLLRRVLKRQSASLPSSATKFREFPRNV